MMFAQSWNRVLGVSVWAVMAMVAPAGALTVPFTEDFVAGSANWFDATASNAMTWHSNGGPDGGSYASTTFNFAGSGVADTPAIYRGHGTLGSSGGAFVGDWLGGGVTAFRAFVRHDASTDLTFFARFASPNNFPALVGLTGGPVPPNTWTEFVIPIQPGPGFIPEGPSTFGGVFGNVGNLQIGVFAEPLAGMNGVITFDLDQVSIVPEPASWMLLMVGSMLTTGGLRLRRRRS